MDWGISLKNRRERGGLFGLLARNYLLFTLVLLLLAGGVFALWNAWLLNVYQPADWPGLLGDHALSEGSYERLRHYLKGAGDAFAVYGADGRLVYATEENFDPHCPPEVLETVVPYGSSVETQAFEKLAEDGSRRFLVIRHFYGEGADGQEERVDAALLDQEYRVIFGGLGDGRSRYTPEEYAYLSGRRFPEDQLIRAEFTDTQGEHRTILMREKRMGTEESYQSYLAARWIWLLFLPLYLAAAGAFIAWMRRKIGRPLRRLNEAVEAQARGQTVRVGDCGGPREIRQIGESFDRFADRLAESEGERKRLDEGRQKLIADISHDLKTPITVIAGYVDAICDGKVPPGEQEPYLRAIQSRAQGLTELINAFHEYSKVEHPQFVLQLERTDLCEYLRAYLAGKYDEIDLAGFTLEISIPERAVFCALDRMQFRRVLDNLLSNALRHNRLGTILFFELTQEEKTVLLRVGDNGDGIPPERAQTIFEPFVVGSEARSGKGSGLGLAITRRVMEGHGGEIRLEPHPRPGRSTEFVLTLPRMEG